MEQKGSEGAPKRYAILINLAIIIAVAITGVFIAYFSLAVFTKHGQETEVPKVEDISYTQAIETLHKKGFNVEIRDSVFRDDIRPGYVIEQFPRANSKVKPGRKIFLYINAVHPKEVVIDDEALKGIPALKDWSLRQVRSRLNELGFKNVRIVTVMGMDDRVVKILADGKTVFKMEKVPVNRQITIQVSDGRLNAVRDSLYDAERLREIYDSFGDEDTENTERPEENSQPPAEEEEYYEEPDYFIINDGDEF